MKAYQYVLGIDLGTSGVKVLVIRSDGRVISRGKADLPSPIVSGERREQDSELWWAATVKALTETLDELRRNRGNPAHVMAIAVDATSGTVVPVDADLRPLRPGLMYNDGRAKAQAAHLNDMGRETIERLGYRFNSSFSLAKLLWLLENEPTLFERSACVLHQADFITARLTGTSPKQTKIFSDESNALKTGYDILERRWPDYISRAGIEMSKLPAVAAIGETIGRVGPQAAADFGLSRNCRVVGGMTDGTAACAASGAKHIGDMNTTLGTTLVWKMISSKLVCDPEGRLYCHRHPSGSFLPGGAGNAGGEGIRSLIGYPPEEIDHRLDQLTKTLTPQMLSGTITYPLPVPGERFPFVDPDFEPFTTAGNDPQTIYRSCLEGIACIERWGYEVAAELGADCTGEIWTTGRGAYLDAWMQIRADILARPVCRAAFPESAFGSALVAAMNTWYDGSWEATVDHLIGDTCCWEPRATYRSACEDHYACFREACEARQTQIR